MKELTNNSQRMLRARHFWMGLSFYILKETKPKEATFHPYLDHKVKHERMADPFLELVSIKGNKQLKKITKTTMYDVVFFKIVSIDLTEDVLAKAGKSKAGKSKVFLPPVLVYIGLLNTWSELYERGV
jgi:hypothetical protein